MKLYDVKDYDDDEDNKNIIILTLKTFTSIWVRSKTDTLIRFRCSHSETVSSGFAR